MMWSLFCHYEPFVTEVDTLASLKVYLNYSPYPYLSHDIVGENWVIQ